MESISDLPMVTSEKQKDLSVSVMLYFWFKSAECCNVNRVTAIKALTKYMIKELNWQPQKAGKKILDFFRDTQKATDNDLIEIWKLLQE